MVKKKFYFGKCKGYDRFGNNSVTKERKFPRALRAYFDHKYQQWNEMISRKLQINGRIGMHAAPAGSPEAAEVDAFFEKNLEERREIKRRFMSGGF